jgi:hypothetical protein
LEEAIPNILESEQHIHDLVYDVPEGRIRFRENEKQLSWLEAFTANECPECTAAIKRIVPTIDKGKVAGAIDSTPLLSPERKEFYKTIVFERCEKILRKSFGAVSGLWPGRQP